MDEGPKLREAAEVGDPSTAVVVRDSFYAQRGKRLFDIMLSVLLLPLLLPVMTLIAVGMVHKGQIIYGHRRVGRHGREFTCYKFRTMVIDAELRLAEILANDPAARTEWACDHKLRDDPRITRFGRVLRKTSLDELPQIWNVLRGDMSFVGPRPVTRAELAKYGDVAAAYMSVRPGITGQWQVTGRNEVSYAARVTQDAQYIANIKLALDVAIIAQTAFVPLKVSGR